MTDGMQQGMGSMPAMKPAMANVYGQQANGLQADSRQLSYEQFQEQQRRLREQDEIRARQALQQAGADSRSEKVRELVNDLQGIRSELQLAENQLQTQMDAQRRQLASVMDRISRMEARLSELMRQPQTPLQ